MERYFLLRDNRESGPYTVKELKAKGLYPTDLLWSEGESSSWKNPTEIAQLKDLVTDPEKKPAMARKLVADAQQDAIARTYKDPLETDNTTTVLPISQGQYSPNETSYNPSFEENKFSFLHNEPRKNAWRQSLNIGSSLFGLAIFLIAVMLTAVMVKKAVDNLEEDSPEEATADAREIVTENLNENVSKHAALSAVPMVQTNVSATDSTSKQTVGNDSLIKLQKQILLAKKEALARKTPAVIDQPDKKDSTINATATNIVTQEPKVEETKPVVDEAAEKAAARASLQVSANDYKKGLFGGISDLQLTVSNPSSRSLDNIAIEVEYLKPNGKVVGKKTVDAGSIAAGASKTLTVPDNGRGVSIRYHVVE